MGNWIFRLTEAYDALDPNGNITIRWDIMSWTPDGYVVSISASWRGQGYIVFGPLFFLTKHL